MANMKKTHKVLFMIFLVCPWFFQGIAPGSLSAAALDQAESGDVAAIRARYTEKLQLLFEYRKRIRHLHPILNELHPVALVENDHFYLFDLDESGEKYQFIMKAPTKMPVPVGVRAAFPLDFYDNKPACVVSGDVFDSTAGYVTMFHEFIHCHQWNTVEPGLKDKLPLAVRAMEKRDYMWEINYPFPYDCERFEQSYTAWIQALDELNREAVLQARERLKEILDPFDYQYMVWQEWKEGFALYLENEIRNYLDIGKNLVGRKAPYNRTAFYAGGAGYIKYLLAENPELTADLEGLFYFISGF